MSDGPSGGGRSIADRVERLHAELEATEERPVERGARRWIGEAQAVAAGARGLDGSAARERVGRVRDLLENVDATGDETADEHVKRAKQIAAAVTGDG